VTRDDGESWSLGTAYVSGKHWLPLPPRRKSLSNRDCAVRVVFYLYEGFPCGATCQYFIFSKSGEASICAPADNPMNTRTIVAKDQILVLYMYWDLSRIYCYKGKPIKLVLPDGRWFALYSVDEPWPSPAGWVAHMKKQMALGDDAYYKVEVKNPCGYPNIHLYDGRDVKEAEVPEEDRTESVSEEVYLKNLNREEPWKVPIPYKFNKEHPHLSEEQLWELNCPSLDNPVDERCLGKFRDLELLDRKRKEFADARETSKDDDESKVETSKADDDSKVDTEQVEEPMNVDVETENVGAAATGEQSEEAVADVVEGDGQHSQSSDKTRQDKRIGRSFHELLSLKPDDDTLKANWGLPKFRIDMDTMDYEQLTQYDDDYFEYLESKEFPTGGYVHLVGNHENKVWRMRDMRNCTVFEPGMQCPIPECQLKGKKYECQRRMWSHWRLFHIEKGASFAMCERCHYICTRSSDFRKHVFGCYKRIDLKFPERTWAKLLLHEFLALPSLPQEFMDLIPERLLPYWFPMLPDNAMMKPEDVKYVDDDNKKEIESSDAYFWIWLYPAEKDPRLPMSVMERRACCPRPTSNDWQVCKQKGYNNYDEMMDAGDVPTDLTSFERGDGPTLLSPTSRANLPSTPSSSRGRGRGVGRGRGGARGKASDRGTSRDRSRVRRGNRKRGKDESLDRNRDDDSLERGEDEKGEKGEKFTLVESRRTRKKKAKEAASGDEFEDRDVEETEGVKPTHVFSYDMDCEQLILFIEHTAEVHGKRKLDVAYTLFRQCEVAAWIQYKYYQTPALQYFTKRKLAKSIVNFRILRKLVSAVYRLYTEYDHKLPPNEEITRKSVMSRMSRRETSEDPIQEMYVTRQYSLKDIDWEYFYFDFPEQPKLERTFSVQSKSEFLAFNNKKFREWQLEMDRRNRSDSRSREGSYRDDDDDEDEEVDDSKRVTRAQTAAKERESRKQTVPAPAVIEKPSKVKGGLTFSGAVSGAVAESLSVDVGSMDVDPAPEVNESPSSPSELVTVQSKDQESGQVKAVGATGGTSVLSTLEGVKMSLMAGSERKFSDFVPKLDHSGQPLAQIAGFNFGTIEASRNYGALLVREARQQGASCHKQIESVLKKSYNHAVAASMVAAGAHAELAKLDLTDERISQEKYEHMKDKIDKLIVTQQNNVKINEKLVKENETLKKQVEDLKKQMESLTLHSKDLQVAAEQERDKVKRMESALKGSERGSQSSVTKETSGASSSRFAGPPDKWDAATLQEMCGLLDAVLLRQPERSTADVKSELVEVPEEIPVFTPTHFEWLTPGRNEVRHNRFLRDLDAVTDAWRKHLKK